MKERSPRSECTEVKLVDDGGNENMAWAKYLFYTLGTVHKTATGHGMVQARRRIDQAKWPLFTGLQLGNGDPVVA